MSSQPPPGAGRPGGRVVIATQARRRRRVLLITLITLVVVIVGFALFANFWTDWLWFQSVGAGSVFSTQLVTRIGLFIAFGLLMAAVVGFNGWLPYRLRPMMATMNAEQASLERYRIAIEPLRRVLFITLPVLLGLLAGASASSEWQTYLLWRNSTPFNSTDPQFGVDISFYTFILPWLRFVLGFLFAVIVLSFLVALVVHYLYGGVRLQSPDGRLSRAAQAHLAVLIGIFMLLKAAAYVLDRYDLAVGQGGVVPGLTYTDVNAVLPAKTVLVFVSLICAVLFFAAAFRGGWRLAATGFGLLLVSSVLVGTLYPAFVQQFQVNPNQVIKESDYISRSIDATRKAFDVDVPLQKYEAASTTPTAAVVKAGTVTASNVRLLDPTLLSPTFTNTQDTRSYYAFSDPLDVDRYSLGGQTVGAIVGVRELNLGGVPAQQRTWATDHIVYTHGYGLVAAYDNQTKPDGSGAPLYFEGSLPSTGKLDLPQPRIYYGENMFAYSVVGAPSGGTPRELDLPANSGNGEAQTYTYTGSGGVQVGSLFNRLLYAVKYQEPSFLLSDLVNNDSRILEVRDPTARVEKIAPWLTLDGDPYPTVVGGKVVWVLDGYTTTDAYPNSNAVSLSDATSDSVTARSSTVTAQPDDQANYLRDSVKITVDAYDGTVTLYQWDTEDPILQTWMKAFPGLVQPKDSIPAELLAHVRYPQDMFKVQRQVLAQYHVTDPSSFLQGTDFWAVPDDPSKKIAGQSQPPYYLQVQLPGSTTSQYELTTTFVPQKRNALAAFMAVNSDPGPNYGQVTVLELPSSTSVKGPAQVQSGFDTNGEVSSVLQSLQRNPNVEVVKGSLLATPSFGGILYVEPVYASAVGANTKYPVLKKVIVGFGANVAIADTLGDALVSLFGQATGPGTKPPVTPTTGTLQEELSVAIAEAQQAFTDGQTALRAADLTAYAAANARLGQAISKATSLEKQIADADAAAAAKAAAKPAATAAPAG